MSAGSYSMAGAGSKRTGSDDLQGAPSKFQHVISATSADEEDEQLIELLIPSKFKYVSSDNEQQLLELLMKKCRKYRATLSTRIEELQKMADEQDAIKRVEGQSELATMVERTAEAIKRAEEAEAQLATEKVLEQVMKKCRKHQATLSTRIEELQKMADELTLSIKMAEEAKTQIQGDRDAMAQRAEEAEAQLAVEQAKLAVVQGERDAMVEKVVQAIKRADEAEARRLEEAIESGLASGQAEEDIMKLEDERDDLLARAKVAEAQLEVEQGELVVVQDELAVAQGKQDLQLERLEVAYRKQGFLVARAEKAEAKIKVVQGELDTKAAKWQKAIQYITELSNGGH
jgi:hypothetical protein